VGGDALGVAFAGVVGLCVGSFLNVCIARLPAEDPKARSLFRPPSNCPRCHHPIAWYDNVPILSWLWLRAKCRYCGQPISGQYPLVEATVALLWVAAVAYFGPTFQALQGALFGTVLLGIAIIDARHQIIPHELNFGGLVIGLALALHGGAPTFVQAMLGAAVGLGVLWAVRIIGGWVFKEEAMGLGDVFMMAMVGSFVGWKGVLLTIFAGALFGTAASLPQVLTRRRRVVPFGVYLAMGAVVTFLFGNGLVEWYLQFLRGS
jgi:leader peptidase (prepilin peptidase) / N-methyltransferase